MSTQSYTVTAALLASLYLSLPAAAAPAAVADEALKRAATSALLGNIATLAPGAAPTDTFVEISKSNAARNWVMGSVTQILGANREDVPVTRLFIARQNGKSWTLALQGSEAFFSMLDSAPDAVLSSAEKSAFRSQRKTAGTASKSLSDPGMAQANAVTGDTGLSLPWAEGVAWYMGGGAHGDSGTSRPFDSLDFSGGDGQVLAPRDGRIYKSCVRNSSAIVQLVHDNGYTTRYYHMVNLPNLTDGTLVRKGAYLGQMGMGLPCGGSTTGPHVHFSLSYNGQAMPVNGKTLGGWQFFETGTAYQGYAMRNGRRVNQGGSLINYGSGTTTPPQTGKTVTVKTPEANRLANLRSAPKLSASILGTARNGDRIQIVCHAYGDWVDGTWGRTQLWNRLAAGSWISDGLVDTGSNQPIVPLCSN
ncbi:M23 family metallopeptidase [Chitinimonas arctica]|uniref:M23 family metallopeptidase n=1 Tax=Chitinimonas arctica TaxID=2594795 RepID=A0A516SIT6_9NEIS|nr:M23 family metallopeptidase [Chitinimonas arctica]QDQ28057.1 M23 family metallopeptidase [Chitinimonas arctica]